MAAEGFELRRVAGALGAEVHGIDLSREQPAQAIAALRRAWLDHGVLFFRDQSLSPAQYLRLAGWFGQPVEYPFVKGLDDFPMITPVVKLEHERNNFGGIWHSDTTYLEQPPMASMLIAREVPPFGGDTLFACQYSALEALSPALQATLATLTGVSSSAKADVSRTREDRIRDGGREDARQVYSAEHPVLRTHPETGRRALYVNIAHTARFAGWTDEESAPLLAFLFSHQVRPEFTCRFSWQPGSIAIWDNRCVQHNPVNDYHGHRRVMHRITLAGDRPR
ncbi:MAG: TauD/TfdA dioxygenase family protein [bacterium]|jgi:taurine dioxygenase|nr:TauD/TfdA family dioxygenase [Betaproteobacteria bacterium]